MAPLFGRDRGRSPEAAVVALIAGDAPNVLAGASVEAGTGDMLVPVSEGRARVSTASIVAHALTQPDAARAEIVRRWLVDVAAQVGIASSAASSASPPRAGDLRLQIMPAWEPTHLAAVASSPVPTCFDALVVYPDGSRLQFLLREQAQAFGGELEAARIAVGQTISGELLDVDVRDHDADGFRVRMIAKDNCPFVTTALMSLARFLPVQTLDALVIAPRYSAIALVPLLAKTDIHIATGLAHIAATMHQDATDPCSAGVYWWHDKVFHQVEIDDDGTVSLPNELTEAVAGLA